MGEGVPGGLRAAAAGRMSQSAGSEVSAEVSYTSAMEVVWVEEVPLGGSHWGADSHNNGNINHGGSAVSVSVPVRGDDENTIDE